MRRSPRTGFTLTELLVVICIAAISIGLLLPSVRRVREPANRSRCMSNLRQLCIAMQNLESTGRPATNPSASQPDPQTGEFFPTGCLGQGSAPEERLSWMVAMLPYLEMESLYRQFDIEKGYSTNLAAAETRIYAFLCPAAREADLANAVTHYVAMSGIGRGAAEREAGAAGNGFMGYDRLTSRAMIKDGTANTIALMETRFDIGPWARGGASNLRGFDAADIPLHGDGRPFGGHADRMLVVMVDGSGRSILPAIDPKKLAAAITIAGGEDVELD